MSHCAVKTLRTMVLLVAVLVLCACAQLQQETHLQMEMQLRAERPETAMQILEQQTPAAKASALYFLNKAMVLRQLGEFEQSIVMFEKAKNVIGRLSATSISESIAAYTVSEQFNKYQATNYERLFVHIYQILNFMELRRLDEARVEAMQIDIALNRLTEVGHFAEAAAARYITGLVFESNREPDAALVAYRRAYENYKQANIQTPRDLRYRLAHLSGQLGVEADIHLSENSLESLENYVPKGDQGQLVIFTDIDFAPRKTQASTTVLDPESDQIIRISLPRYLSRHIAGVRVEFQIEQTVVAGELISDVEAIAQQELETQMPELTLRAISRTVTKYHLTKKADKESELLGHLVNFAGAVLEQADTRNWLTLPNQIQLASFALAPGTYAIQAEVLDRHNNRIGKRQIDAIEITSKQTTFLHFSWHKPLNNRLH